MRNWRRHSQWAVWGAKEVASLTLFLCSDAAAFITGVDYPTDGGFVNLHG